MKVLQQMRGWAALLATAVAIVPAPARGEDTVRQALIRDVTSIEGVRENPLIGYGMGVGLNGTGDRQQTLFTTQTLASVLDRMGVQISPTAVVVKNVAAVFVTANLPPFARPGAQLDVTVSSIGDAKSLEGGLLLLTPLKAADGVVYAAAQGPLTVGGYSAGQGGNSKQVNHPTVGRIPSGGLVEKDASLDLSALPHLTLLLTVPDFSTAEAVAGAVNRDLGEEVATARDSRQVVIRPGGGLRDWSSLLARVENLTVAVRRRAKVVVNERTGTIVMGKQVRLGAVAILHGNLSIEVTTEHLVSQPAHFARGDTKVVAETDAKAQESPARRVEVNEGASVEQLVSGLQAIGATARDVIAILQAIKAAGALEADLEVI
jgi:flagellar P-ring protein precursor FlgI